MQRRPQLEPDSLSVKLRSQVDSQTGDEQFQALSKYAVNLTAKAATLDPVQYRVQGFIYIDSTRAVVS